MHSPARLTYFDTPGRLAGPDLVHQAERTDALPLVRAVLDGVPLPAFIVNDCRQVLLANAAGLRLMNAGASDVLGKRFGELIDCVHANDAPAGCGTTLACTQCGAARGLLQSRQGHVQATDACRVSTRTADGTCGFEFDVTVTSIDTSGDTFYLLVLQDAFSEHRRQLLERMFVHDVMNTAGALQGVLSSWADLSPEEAADLAPLAVESANSLVEEIEGYRDMAAAERGELLVRPVDVDARDLLSQLQATFARHAVAIGKEILLSVPMQAPRFRTDPVLLRRVLGNLLKNALEASEAGQNVTLGLGHDYGPTFTVHNETVMPVAVQLQMFQRSFSTKAEQGRGLGTYGARLIVERYLKGTIHFESRAPRGTTFRVHLPPTGPF